jgi:Flp pilus assembly protein TadG
MTGATAGRGRSLSAVPGRARRSRRAGQVVAEVALAVTAFLVLALAVLDFGRGLWTWQLLASVAREAARWAIVHGDDAGLTPSEAETQCASWVQSQFGGSLPADAKLTFDWPNGTNEPGDPVRVTVQSDFKPVTPLLGSTKVKLQGVSEMRVMY